MKEFWNMIQFTFAALGGWLGWFLGGCDGLLYALLVFVIVDYVTGSFARSTTRLCPARWASAGFAGRSLSLHSWRSAIS